MAHNRYLRQSEPTRGSTCSHTILSDQWTGEVTFAKFVPAGSDAAGPLRREATLLGGIGHPGVVRFAGGLAPETTILGAKVCGFKTTWIDGVGLAAWARKSSFRARIEGFCQLVHVVAHLHRCGLLHLDLKPSNVLVARGGRIVLVDFGTARMERASETGTGGTRGFAAPEVVEQQAPSEAADVYGLGAVLYELITGVAPFGGVAESDLLHQQRLGPARSVQDLSPETPRALGALAARMLAPDPVSRPNDLNEVLERVRADGIDPGTPDLGEPPLLGRGGDVQNLRELIATPGHVAVVGPVGIGRRRVCDAVLHELGHEREVVDLSGCDHWQSRVDRVVAPATLFLGERDAVRLHASADILARCAQSDVQILVSVVRAPLGMRTFHLAPLGHAEMEQVARFTGLPRCAATTTAVRSAAGVPGALLAAVRLERVETTPAADELIQLLGLFPGGVPQPALERLLPGSRALSVLMDRGVVRVRDAWLYADLAGAGTLDHDLRARLAVVASEPEIRAAFPEWSAFAFQLLGDREGAAGCLAEVLAQDRAPSEELLSYLAWLATNAVPGAGAAHACLLLGDGRPEEALEAARRSPASPDQAFQEMGALVELGRAEEALAVGASAAAHFEDPGLWCGLAAYRLSLDDFAGTEAAVDRAEACDVGAENGAGILGLRLSLRIASIGPDERVDPALLAQAAQLSDASDLSPVTLSRLGRTAMRCGNLDLGRRFLEAAAQAVRARGFDAEIAYTMLNLGNLELRAQCAPRARALFVESLQAARARG